MVVVFEQARLFLSWVNKKFSFFRQTYTKEVANSTRTSCALEKVTQRNKAKVRILVMSMLTIPSLRLQGIHVIEKCDNVNQSWVSLQTRTINNKIDHKMWNLDTWKLTKTEFSKCARTNFLCFFLCRFFSYSFAERVLEIIEVCTVFGWKSGTVGVSFKIYRCLATGRLFFLSSRWCRGRSLS